MKIIYLLRHAKSSWDDPRIPDFERVLNERGKEAAKRMGKYFKAEGIRPGLVLCSAAARARETLAGLGHALDGISVEFEKGLYLAPASSLLNRLRRIEEARESALLIGHNPGLERLAQQLAKPGDPLLARLREKYPTAGFCALESGAGTWADLRPGNCRIAFFVRPRDLD